MIEIMSAQSGEPLEAVIVLAHEYVVWMLAMIEAHYPELDIGEFTSEHEYDDIRKKFPGDHKAPDGCLLIARVNNQVAGCIALGRLNVASCELRTLFVRPDFRGMGIGRSLVDAALANARALNYEYACLDTLGFMQSALDLYHSVGFHDIEAYRNISTSLQQHIRFLELKLADPAV